MFEKSLFFLLCLEMCTQIRGEENLLDADVSTAGLVTLSQSTKADSVD